jgi:2-phospho-L-lactate guanylyltransferase
MTVCHPELWAAVPVKSFGRAKQRLIGLLSGEERQALARAMLDDVVSALACAASLAGVAVITADAEAAGMARAAGASIILDADERGETAAVTRAGRRFEGMGIRAMLVIPADVPLITPADVDALVSAHRCASSPSLTLVPAGGDGGTNALVCSPPCVIPFAFGEDSFRRHRDAARARGIEPMMARIESIGCDIDRPGDLVSFLERPSATRTYRYLAAIDASRRLQLACEKAADRLHTEPSVY